MAVGGCVETKQSRWLGSRYCFCLGCAESESLSWQRGWLWRLGSTRTWLSRSIRRQLASLPFFSTSFPPFTSAHPMPTPQILRCFQISESGSGHRESLASSGLDLPPAQGECQVLMENYFSSDPLPSYLNGGSPLLHWWILSPYP